MMKGMIAGHLGSDPEERTTSGGKKVTSFRVAVNLNKEETVWWRVSVWGDTPMPLLRYLKKGSSVIVTGRMRAPQIYTDRNGQPQVSMEITASDIDFPPGGKKQEGEASGQGSYGGYNAAPASGGGSFNEAAPAPGFVSSGGGDLNAFGQSHQEAAQPAFGQGMAAADDDDDQLPF